MYFFVWTIFIAGPIVIGAAMTLPKYFAGKGKVLIYTQLVGVILQLTFILTVFVQLNEKFDTVFLFPFVAGCSVGIVANILTERYNMPK